MRWGESGTWFVDGTEGSVASCSMIDGNRIWNDACPAVAGTRVQHPSSCIVQVQARIESGCSDPHSRSITVMP